MICEELRLICKACAERYVNVVDRGDRIIVYADLMKDLFSNPTFRRVVEIHAARCAYEIATTIGKRVERHGWQEVGGKMRYFCIVV